MLVRTNFNRFKEPRGFIKIIEFVIAILAFSTTAGYHSKFTGNIAQECGSKKTVNHLVTVKFSYPFEKLNEYFDGYECIIKHSANYSSEDLEPSTLKSSSQFFVFVGVISFLYCIVAVIYYVCFEDPAKYGPGGTGRELKSFATVDFGITILLTFFWFCGSIAWAVGLAKLKDKTDAEDYCEQYTALTKNKCNVDDKANYAGLTISVLFGFLSVFLWGANLWFLFKETVWHKEPGAVTTAEQPSAEIPRQEVPGESVP